MAAMQKIFLEAANSYRAPADLKEWDDVVMAYYKGMHIDKLYSVIKRESNKVRVEHLPGYVYRMPGQAEDANIGCVYNGQTNANELLACLARAKETGPDVVYIISANSAHNWTYALSKRAFEATKNQKTKVVVNFDNHRDYGSGAITSPGDAVGAKMIQCGGWGKFHVMCWKNNPGGAVYLTLANGTEKSKGIHCAYSVAQNGQVQTTIYKTNQEVFDLLASYAEATHEVYFTVDRDFMTGNGTKYEGQGSSGEVCEYTTENGLKFVEDCIKIVKAHGVIIGQDIIGLPTNGDRAGVAAEEGKSKDGMKRAIANVNAYVQALGAKVPKAAKAPAGKAPNELPNPKEHPIIDFPNCFRGLGGQKPFKEFAVDKDSTKFLITLRKELNDPAMDKFGKGSGFAVYVHGKDTPLFRAAVNTVVGELERVVKEKGWRQMMVRYTHKDLLDKENDPPMVCMKPWG